MVVLVCQKQPSGSQMSKTESELTPVVRMFGLLTLKHIFCARNCSWRFLFPHSVYHPVHPNLVDEEELLQKLDWSRSITDVFVQTEVEIWLDSNDLWSSDDGDSNHAKQKSCGCEIMFCFVWLSGISVSRKRSSSVMFGSPVSLRAFFFTNNLLSCQSFAVLIT